MTLLNGVSNMADDTVQRTLRIPLEVDAAFQIAAQKACRDEAELMTDVLSEYVLHKGYLTEVEAKRLQAEIAIKETARDLAQEICAEQHDPNVTLKVFQRFKTDDELCDLYRTAIGGNPNQRGNHVQARINRNLGNVIKGAVRGTALILS